MNHRGHGRSEVQRCKWSVRRTERHGANVVRTLKCSAISAGAAMSAADHLRSAAHLHDFAPSALLGGLCVGALWWARRSPWGLALLALPGTFAHELAHLLVGVGVNARPVQFSLWPQRRGAGWTLGSVSFRNLGVFNADFVAYATVLLLALGWALLPTRRGWRH